MSVCVCLSLHFLLSVWAFIHLTYPRDSLYLKKKVISFNRLAYSFEYNWLHLSLTEFMLHFTPIKAAAEWTLVTVWRLLRTFSVSYSPTYSSTFSLMVVSALTQASTQLLPTRD